MVRLYEDVINKLTVHAITSVEAFKKIDQLVFYLQNHSSEVTKVTLIM